MRYQHPHYNSVTLKPDFLDIREYIAAGNFGSSIYYSSAVLSLFSLFILRYFLHSFFYDPNDCIFSGNLSINYGKLGFGKLCLFNISFNNYAFLSANFYLYSSFKFYGFYLSIYIYSYII